MKILQMFYVLWIALLAVNIQADPAGLRADGHAPIGVMGDHMHKRGEWMFSYRYMQMSMSGNLQDDSKVSSETIATTVPNRFAGMPMMPANVRVVPVDMDTQMHMLGIMYAPSDKVTLMLMVNHLTKSMTLETFQGMMGANVLGEFSTETSGFGDVKAGALLRLLDEHSHKLHANFMLSLPTGSIEETDQILTPMNMRMTRRLPYAMQLGSGTTDLMPALTYNGYALPWSWGAQLGATLRTEKNKHDYAYGDEHRLTAWGQYGLSDSWSINARYQVFNSEDIDGLDAHIMLPTQTANPAFYGKQTQSIALGFNWVGLRGRARGHRLAAEWVVPVVESVNGVQMSMDSMLTLGYQYAF